MRVEDFTPIDDRIVVKPHKADEKTKGGIYLPAQVIAQRQETVQSGEVVAVGPGRFNSQGEHEAMMDIRIGDIIYFPRHLGWLFMLEEDGEETEFRLFGVHDIFGVRRRNDE